MTNFNVNKNVPLHKNATGRLHVVPPEFAGCKHPTSSPLNAGNGVVSTTHFRSSTDQSQRSAYTNPDSLNTCLIHQHVFINVLYDLKYTHLIKKKKVVIYYFLESLVDY